MSTSGTNNIDLPPLQPTPPGLYRHYKGAWYEVIDTVRCSEILKGMTLYRALYGSFGLWVRRAAGAVASALCGNAISPRCVNGAMRSANC